MPLGGGSWSFGGVNFDQLGVINTTVVTGLTNLPEIRGNNVEFAGIHGDRFVSKVFKGRRLALELVVTPSLTDYLSMFATLDTLAKTFAVSSQEQALVHNHPDGTVRTASAQCVQWNPAGDPKGTAVTYRGVADFYLSDPFFYLPSVLSVQTISGSPYTFTVTNPGTARGYKMLITFTGAITNPRLTNTTNGVWVQYTGAIGGGHQVVIDSGAWTATTETGTNVIGSLSHSGAFPFMLLEPGVNSFSITSTSAGGFLNLTFYPPCL